MRSDVVELSLPFTGPWLTQNSPVRRVPSHGSDLFGERYAVDFVGVDEHHRTARARDWRTWFATEPAQRFFAFGQPILAPISGIVVEVHAGEIDHEARRSQLALVPYALSQASRVRHGFGAIAGNYMIIALAAGNAFVAVAHLQAGSIRASVGQHVAEGEQIASSGNSGNSTQPHVHLQAMDSLDLSVARGLPMTFRHFREWPHGGTDFQIRQSQMPGEGSVVEPIQAPSARSGSGRATRNDP
jgi:murein DD-endopeptidase MepM/ murein hydrolase activator NlpD